MTVTERTTPRRVRGLIALVAAALAVPLGAQLANPQTAEAATTYKVIASPCLNMRTTPSGPIISCIPYGTYVALQCVTSGPSVTGPYGASSMWYRTAWAGQTGYSSDAWIYTGTSAAVAPGCATTTTVPAPTATRETKAVNWALSMVGSQNYPGLCERFAENAYGTSGRHPSAISAFYALRNAGQMRYTTNPPKGALVFSKSAVDQGYGHVQVAVGDGSFVSGGMGNPTVKRTWRLVPGAGGTFLGWAPAPSSWPGR